MYRFSSYNPGRKLCEGTANREVETESAFDALTAIYRPSSPPPYTDHLHCFPYIDETYDNRGTSVVVSWSPRAPTAVVESISPNDRSPSTSWDRSQSERVPGQGGGTHHHLSRRSARRERMRKQMGWGQLTFSSEVICSL